MGKMAYRTSYILTTSATGLVVNSAGQEVKKDVSWVRTRLSGHALETEDAHKLVRAEVTAADEVVVLLPGANALVALVKAVKQLLRSLAELRVVKNAEHPELIPVGIKGFAVAVTLGVAGALELDCTTCQRQPPDEAEYTHRRLGEGHGGQQGGECQRLEHCKELLGERVDWLLA